MIIHYKKLSEKEVDKFIELRINQLREEGATEDIDLTPALKDYYIRHLTDGTFVSWLAMDGEKTVCFGGDMDGCDILASGIDGLQSIPKIYKALQLRGYSETLLEDLFWNNLRRLF